MPIFIFYKVTETILIQTYEVNFENRHNMESNFMIFKLQHYQVNGIYKSYFISNLKCDYLAFSYLRVVAKLDEELLATTFPCENRRKSSLGRNKII